MRLDEKAYKPRHRYATIPIDAARDCIVEMVEAQREEACQGSVFPPKLRGKATCAQSGQHGRVAALHERHRHHRGLGGHSEQQVPSIQEVVGGYRQDGGGGRNGLLKGKKYNVLKNRENRTGAQQKRFEEMVKANLLTAKTWQIRENFKYLFAIREDIEAHYQMWKDHAISQSIQALDAVIKTFDNHLAGIFNAIRTRTSSGKHENMNGRIQSVIAKARGGTSFERVLE